MAKTVSDEEIQLRKRARRRLVGAIAMVIAAVVILPMVLDSQPEQGNHDIDIRIPGEDAVTELAPDMEYPDEAPVPPSPIPREKPAPETPAAPARSTQEKSEAEKPKQPATGSSAALRGMDTRLRERSGTQSEAASMGASAAPARIPDTGARGEPGEGAAGEGRFVVQSGAFSNPSKAEQQVRRLESSGIGAYTEAFGSGKNQVTRVRIGPFSTREEADRVRKQLKDLGLGAVVTEK